MIAKILSIAVVAVAMPLFAQEKSLAEQAKKIKMVTAVDIIIGQAKATKSEGGMGGTSLNEQQILESVRFNGQTKTPSDFATGLRQKLKERERSGGGDDVGNGGDHLRQYFLAVGNSIVEQMSDIALAEKLKPTLDTRRVMVVDNLKMDNGSEVIAMKSMAAEGHIFLDSATWDEANGLLSGMIDPRFEILRLMHLAAKVPVNDEELTAIYSSLAIYIAPNNGQAAHVAPWCSVNLSSLTVDKVAETFKESHSSDESIARQRALATCHNKGLKECRVKETIRKGFLGKSSFHVTVQGMRYSSRHKTGSELAQETCRELQRCELMYELAPVGQIPPGGANEMMKKVEETCR